MASELPGIVYWLMSTDVVLISLPGRDATYPDIPGSRLRAYTRPWRPLGAVAWRTSVEEDWQPLDTLPPEWDLRLLTKLDVPQHDQEEEYQAEW